MATTTELNRSLVDKSVYKFYCTFLRINDNDANILGRQVKRIGRPTLSFAESTFMHKGHRVTNPSRIDFGEVSVTFADDSGSLVSKALYTQLYKQARRLPVESQEELYFDINVKIFAPDDQVIEQFVLEKCWITNISHSEQVYSESTGNEITCTLKYNSADYIFE